MNGRSRIGQELHAARCIELWHGLPQAHIPVSYTHLDVYKRQIHGITVLNLLNAHLQGSMKLVIGHGVSVQSRRSLRQG